MTLPRAIVDEQGVHFETGVPVRFRFLRNTTKAPRMGARFQQNIEPAGRYMVHNETPGDVLPPWSTGMITFNTPLVILFNLVPNNPSYDASSWKAILHKEFKLRGKALSRYLQMLGYDGIVTVQVDTFSNGRLNLATREIVALPAIGKIPKRDPGDHGDIAPWQMTVEQFRTWSPWVPPEGYGGQSMTPAAAMALPKGEYETLFALGTYQDPWRLLEALGKGYEGSWPRSLHLIPAVHGNVPIWVYRASDVGDIIPGSYVTELREYAIAHGQTCIPGGRFKVYRLKVRPSELMTLGDPHEFIYVPDTPAEAHRRIVVKALRQKKRVPLHVLQEHGLRQA